LTNNLGKILYENDKAFDASAESASWSKDNKSVIVTTSDGGQTTDWIFSLATQELSKSQ
jgi:hypothetical protein